MSRRPIRRTASLILLMLLLPVAAADTIQMFTNGSDSVSFGTQTDIRTDSGLLYDGDSVKISIPAAHSIVQASLNISVEPSVSSGSIVYPAPGTVNPWEDYADIYASFVGDGSDTALSDEMKGSQMTVTDPYLALFSEGNGSDFEGDDGGFKSTTNTSELKDGSDFHLNSTSDFRKADGTPSMEKYIGGFQVNGYAFGPIADGCLGGDSNTCWGTNFDDYFYLDDGTTNEWEYLFESPIYEYANSNPVLTFKSWHGLAEVANGPIDCAYVQVAAANTLEEFDEDRIQWTAMTLNGSTPTNSEIWTSTQQDYVSNNDCDGPGAPENPEGAPSIGDKVLTGRSQAGSGGGTGWADVKYNLEENGIYSSYVKFRFVMEYNKPSGVLENQSLPGWYVDNVQFGDKKVNGAVALSPAVSTSQSTASAGFGVAFVDIYEPVAGDVSISVVDTYTREVITDDAGVELKDLRPPIIELWDVNSSKHPSIRLAIEMSSGPNNLRTPYLKSYHIGHSLVVNSVQKDFITYDENTFVKDGTIASERWKPINGSWLRYAPKIPVHGLESAALGDRFSHPVIGIDPSVIHDCPSPPWVNLSTGNNTSVSLSLDQINQLPNQTHTLDFNITFPNMSADCAVESFTFDLQFGLYPEGLAVDIGGDGDTDWSMMDPAFGAFGRQQMFYLTTTMDGVSRGSLLRNITVASGGATAGQGVGGHFILPAGAVIDESVIGVLANEVGNFSLWLATKTSAGPVVEEHVTDYRHEWGPSHPSLDTHMSGFSRALHNLSTHPDVAASRVDDNGDTWNEYYFIIRNATDAQAGSTEIQLGEMSVRYFWTTAITDTRSNLIRELNQGASITPPSGQNTEIPLLVYTRTAGGASFEDLTVVTVEGLDSIWGFRSFNTGLYPTGEIYSQETTHLSAVADSSISGARLVFESETGDAAIKYDVQTNTFTEEDPLDLIILDGSSSATSLGAGQLKVTWKFRVNTNWEDTAVVQFYGSTIVDTNLGARYEGKPVGYTFDPDGGNAVENDAYFSQFEIHNTAGVRQTDFTEVRTTPELTLSGQVRLENLDISPDPKLYNLSLERYVPSDSSYTVADVCMPDVSTSTCTVTHGNFTWNLTLASSEEAVYRLRIDDYSGGDLLDVPAEITPDPQLLPQDNSSVYFKVNISNVQSSPTITDLSYRFGSAGTGFYWPFLPLGGSTWLSPNREGAGTPQMINATVRDIKQTLGAVTMHYWLSGIDDISPADGQAQEAEYTEVPMTRIGSVSDTIKYFHAELDDRPSDPGGTTVISVYFTGVDEFGNPLTSEADIIENAGGPGVTNDLLTYKAMNAARPSADSFSLYDVYGNQMLDDPATLFAGNTYKLCVDGSDSNGWVDVKTIEIDLMNTSKGDQPLSIADYKIIYDPENVTFSRPDAGEVSVYDPDRYVVDGVETSIIELVSPMNITRPDGVAYLQDPFEESFRACVSIQLSWNIPGNIVNKSTEFDPVVSVIDRFGFSSVKSSGLQSFMYSDGLVLTDLQIIEHNDVDEIDVRDTWIYTSTQLNISGRYVYLDGLGQETDALPEAPLTLGLYREGADRPADRPWDAALPEIQCWTFTGGVFDVTFQAPIRTQQYVYHVDLVEDDQDRCEDSQQPPALDIRDFTPAGERLFNLYTDNDAPSLSVNDQGQSIFNVNGLTRSDPSTIPISRIECFEYSVFIFDSEHPGPDALPDSTPYLLKWVYYDPETKDFWSEAKETSSQPKVFSESLKEFQITTNSYKFESKAEGGTCIDLWPLNRAVPSTVTDVQIRMWIEGEDSAGNELAGGGSYQTPLIEMFVESLEARFEIILGSVPAIEGGETNTVSVDESFTVYFQFDNIGTVAGSFDYTLYLVDEDQLIPITSSTSPELAPDASDYGAFSILVPGQPLERSQLRLRLVDGDSGEKMWESQNPFNIVPKEVTSTLGLGSVEEAGDIIVLLIVVSSTVVLLLVVVIVVLLRGRSPEYDDEDVIDDSVFAMPRYTTESQGGTYGSGDAYAQAEQYAQQEYGYDPRYAQQDWQQQQQQQQQQQNWQQQQQPQEGWQQQQQPQQGWQQQQQPQQGHAPPQQGYGQQQGGQNQGWYQQDEQY